MKPKYATSKQRKIVLTLSDRDNAFLLEYAREREISRSVAAKQIIHQALMEYAKTLDNFIPENQLRLFDSVQVDIFEIIEKEK